MTDAKDVAFYYPGPMWRDGDWIKNLLLFFDGIGLLLPTYMGGFPERVDPALVAGLRENGLLHIIEPELAVDANATAELAKAVTDLLAAGRLDFLRDRWEPFQEISMSRLGYLGDRVLFDAIVEGLRARELAGESSDGVSIPMHPHVRSLVLVLLAQILRPKGTELGVELCPTTDRPELVEALCRLVAADHPITESSVISFDLGIVGVDLGPFPIDEVLDFRRQHSVAHAQYRRKIKLFTGELSRMPAAERHAKFEECQEELDQLAADLRRSSRTAWRAPATFALGLAGAAWSAHQGDPVAAMLAAGAAVLAGGSAPEPDLGAYSFLFRANRRFR
jgi:hypothetical protein